MPMGSTDYGEASAFIKKYRLAHSNSLPWSVAYSYMLSRCAGYSARDRKTYGGKKCLISSAELRVLFYRDTAWLMKKPSADRIDPDGDYTKENVRWVEWDKNRATRYMKARPEKYAEGKALVKDFLGRCGWKKHLRRSFVNTLVRDLRSEGWA